jgi:hypothetical protein
MTILFETLGIECHFAQSSDEFVKLVYDYNPHLAFAHIQEVSAVLKLKHDPAVSGTPTVIVNSIGQWGDKAMSEAGLTGPMIQLPYSDAHPAAAIECFGRSDDQPFPEPLPYLIGDPSLIETRAQPMDPEGLRRLLIVADEGFSSIYVSRTLNGLGQILHAKTRRDARGALMVKRLDLVVVVDTHGYAIAEIDRSARAADVPVLALISEDRVERTKEITEGRIKLHLWPTSKSRLVELAKGTLTRCPRLLKPATS